VKTHTEGSDENADDEPLDLSEWTVRDEAVTPTSSPTGSCWSPAVG
jgi:hypothetical protein